MDPVLAYVGLGSAVTASIRARIVTGQLAPGERLVEADLAAHYRTSRGPVRDALADLTRTGLVETNARRGTFVRRLAVDDVDEIYSLRTLIEPFALRHAMRLARTVLATTLRDLLGQLDQASAVAAPLEVATVDIAMHRAIVTASGHRRALVAWEALADQTLLLMTQLAVVAPSVPGPDGHHRRLVDEVAGGDADTACATLEAHLEQARAVMAARVGEKAGSAGGGVVR